jgi:hypothetical protein
MSSFRVVVVALPALLILIGPSPLHGEESDLALFPRVEIRSGGLRALVYLPDPEKGSYRGTRFDWSGVIRSLTWRGHEFFGRWYARHDPQVHDAITGPVDVFETGAGGLGYAEAKPGQNFVRIGVGLVERPDEKPFESTRTYRIVHSGKWEVSRKDDSVEMRQTLPGERGFAYVYTKTLALRGERAELIVSHTLTNRGTRAIETEIYNHGFFQIDNEPAGPGLVWTLPWQPHALGRFAGMAHIEGSRILYNRELQDGERIYEVLSGYGSSVSDHNYSLENKRTGVGVHISADKPIWRFVFWSRRLAYSPEAYIRLSVAPGKTETWSNKFMFYSTSR